MKLTLVVLLLICSCNSLPWEDTSVVEVKETFDNDREFVEFNYHEEYNDHATNDGEFVKKSSNLTLVGFSWNSCGASSDPVQLKTLTVSPDPIVIPGTVNVDLDATITSTIETATSLSLVLQKKIFGVFVKIPCVDNVGSCTYNNPCGLLSNVTCPPELEKLGWTCRCPIPAKHYVVPSTAFKIPKIPLPPSLESGDYQIEAKLMNGATELACYQVKASLKANN